MKMLSRILSKRSTAPVQLINAQEFEYNEIESSVREASAPRFRFNEIYKKGSFLMDSHRFKILELTVPATGGETDIRLITPKEVSEAFHKKYSYMHIGAVQVGIKLLARDDIDCSVLCVLQDDRITDFKKSLLGTVEASLCNQVAYFNVFPNFTTHLRDAAHCLRLRIKTDGISMKKGMMELAIDYRIYYKLMSSNVTPNTRFLNSPGITTSVLTNPKNNSQQKHVTKWHEVTFPREWNLTPPVRQLESSNASVYEDTGGKISLQFHRHSFANYEEASTSGTKEVYNEESLEEEDTKRPMRMFQAEKLRELYAQAETCDSIEELEKIMIIISQVQIGKKKRKILPYQAAKEEPEPSGASMDTDELRRKTKDNEAHILVEEEYNVFHKKEQEKKMEEEMKTMKFVTSLSQNKEIKESLDSLNSSSNPILGLANDNPVDSLTTGRKINPFTELFNTPIREERIMPVQTSIYSNYITIGLKFPNYKKYHLHAFVDTGSGYSLAKRHAIPEEYWEKSPKSVTGVAMEENKIVMNTMARNVKVSLGGGNFIIKILWQCEGQTADLLLGNDFLLQQTVTQTSKMIGFEKNHRFYWESRLTDAVRVTNKGFTEQYQKLPAKSGDYKPVLNPVLLIQKQLEDHEEILVNEATSSEDSESKKNSEYQDSDNESSDGEEDYIREHNLKVYANKVDQKKIPTLREIENLLKPIISEDPQLYWEKDPIYCQLRMHDANAICHVKAIPHYREEDRKEMENQIQELLEKKLIRPSNSPHHAPAFLVRNHAEQLRGKARMVIDYRDVNKKTVKDGYQIAQVRVLINRLKGAKIFSKFDAKSGFWQVKMHPNSIALTAFGTPQGHYEWLVMPFGLKQAPSIFQRKMDNIFKPYSDFCIVYIDDILVFSKTMNEHLKHLEQVCKLIVQKGIILGQKKIHLIKGEIDFLGIHVKDGEIRLQDHIVKKISQFQDNIPDAKSLQRFLGVVNFARDFIPQVSGLTALLSPKTSSKKKWSFTEDDSNTVRKIKELTKNLPPLILPEEGDLIILQTNANDYYWAGVVLAITPDTNQEKICKFLSGKFNAAELNYSTGDKEVLALIKSIKGAEAFLGNKFVVRTDNKRVKNFKNYKLTDAADRGRVLRWQMFLSQYDYDVEMVAGDKNYLPDALTREMAMFEREGRNQRSRKPVSEEKKLWERYKNGDKTVGPLHDGPGYQYIVSYGAAESSQPPERIKPKLNQKWNDLSGHSKKDADQSITDDEERITKEFLLYPKGTALTDRSQGKRPASPSQTADGKGISSPLMAAALPKSRRDPLRANKLPLVTGKKVIHDQPLKIFQKPVFRTERLLAFKQKIIIDNILYSFYEENEAHLLQTLKALTEEMYGFHAKGKSILAEPSKVVYLENPESTRIPILALKESEWYSFHNLLGERKDVLPETLSIVPGPYYGRYLVDVQADHPQKHKLWLIENGFVHNLWTKTNDDLKGFPKIITEAVTNIRPDGCILRLKFISTPPEWTVVEGQTNYISPYHHVRIIQSPVRTSIAISGNGRPNQSIPWMKAMTIAVIKDIVLRDYDSSLLASGEKIMVTCYNHPPPENCDFFTALMRKEVDCTLATTTWLEKVETEEKYKVSYPYDSDLDNEDEDTAREWENSGPNSSAGYSEDPKTYHNIVNMMEK
ncbi:hypothetical protein ACLB2K_060609 [Fragaria x ananassa]